MVHFFCLYFEIRFWQFNANDTKPGNIWLRRRINVPSRTPFAYERLEATVMSEPAPRTIWLNGYKVDHVLPAKGELEHAKGDAAKPALAAVSINASDWEKRVYYMKRRVQVKGNNARRWARSPLRDLTAAHARFFPGDNVLCAHIQLDQSLSLFFDATVELGVWEEPWLREAASDDYSHKSNAVAAAAAAANAGALDSNGFELLRGVDALPKDKETINAVLAGDVAVKAEALGLETCTSEAAVADCKNMCWPFVAYKCRCRANLFVSSTCSVDEKVPGIEEPDSGPRKELILAFPEP